MASARTEVSVRTASACAELTSAASTAKIKVSAFLTNIQMLSLLR